MPGPLTQVTQGLSEPTDPSVSGWLKYMLSLPQQADNSAELAFPGSARDSSVKNAYRHSLGTGLLAQNLGANSSTLGSYVAPALARLVGLGWEGLSGFDNLTKHGKLTDTLHDLNANAIGAQQSTKAPTADELAAALKALASQSRVESPPSVFEPSPGYLTRTVP